MLGYIRTAPPVPIIPKDDVDTGAVAAARLLDNAADLLAEHGWTHGKMHHLPYRTFITAYMLKAGDEGPMDWNDTAGRTADDVIDLLKRVSEAWDAEHPQ